jgi:hypothetical protein
MPAVATDEETGQQSAVTASGIATLSSPQKSVTWADQELRGRGVNPRHSCESYTSSVSSRSIHLEPPSAASSHEGSPAPTLTPGYPGGFPVGVISMATPPMTSRRPVPEGVGGGAAAVVMFPHHHSTGSVPPLSPTSLLSSGSSLQSGQGLSSVTTTRLGLPTAHPTAQRGLPTAQRGLPTAQRGVPTAQRGVAAGQSPGKSNRRSPQDYHSNGPSSSGSSPASQHGRSRRLIRHNPDGSKTVQSLV